MIYYKKYLVVKLLIENISNYELRGIYRPSAYLEGIKDYCTECQIEFSEPLEKQKNRVIKAVLFAPHGFGEQLTEGSLLTLQNGVTIEAKAIILDIVGYKGQ